MINTIAICVEKELIAAVIGRFLEANYSGLYICNTTHELVRINSFLKPNVIVVDKLTLLHMKSCLFSTDAYTVLLCNENDFNNQDMMNVDDIVLHTVNRELFSFRLKAIMEKIKRIKANEYIVKNLGNTTINIYTKEIKINGNAMTLSKTLFRILDFLTSNMWRVYSRSDLISYLHGEACILEKSIDTNIMRLRKKLADSTVTIQTIRGFGYRAQMCE